MSRAEETRFEIELAHRELTTAKTEAVAVIDRWEADGGGAPRKLDELLAEPLARCELARRSLAAVLERHRWRPFTAPAMAAGAPSRRQPWPLRARRGPAAGAAPPPAV